MAFVLFRIFQFIAVGRGMDRIRFSKFETHASALVLLHVVAFVLAENVIDAAVLASIVGAAYLNHQH